MLRHISIKQSNLVPCMKLVRLKSSKIDEFNYLEKSVLPTYLFERSLPSLPIPSLEDSCNRYAEALVPIIDDKNEFDRVEKIIQNFRDVEGKQLHKELVALNKKNKHTSYISEPWFDYYLSSRSPLPLNFTPFLSWIKDSDAKFDDPVVRSSNFIISSLRFKRSLEENLLKPEIFHLNPKKSDTDFYRKIMRLTPKSVAWYVSALGFHAYALDMSQYKNLFNSTRLPHEGKDAIVKSSNPKHIVVMKNGQFFTVDVLNEDGSMKETDHIYSCIKHIWSTKNSSNAADDSSNLGLLTTMNRDEWANLRKKLVENRSNAENLEKIDSAIFVLCLDDHIKYGDEMDIDSAQLKHSHNFLHGCIEGKPYNRWFDKSFSLIFTKDGQCGLNFEHSWGDGVAVLRYFNEVYADSGRNHFVNGDKTVPLDDSSVKQLQWQLNDDVKNGLAKARKDLTESTGRLDLNKCIFNVNRDYFKSHKVSPDSMFQFAFQSAYYKVSGGKTAVTYESCSTAAFRHGRTETVRSATSATKQACKLINNANHKVPEVIKALEDCSRKHSELTKNAAMGKGFDRHLFAMKYLWNRKGEKLPQLYTDKSYTNANHYTLSTSTLFGDAFSGGGFAPVVADGYGISYGFVGDDFGVLCSTYKNTRDGKQMVDAVEQSLKEIKNVFDSR